MLLNAIESSHTLKVSQTVRVPRSSFIEMWEQTNSLSEKVMDNLLCFVRERFFEKFKGSTTRPIDFLESDFAVAVSKMHLSLKRKNYKVPIKVSKYVPKDRQWFTAIHILYCPYVIDGHWVGLCIDIDSHEITILLPDPTKSSSKKLQKELTPLATSLPVLITECATNSEMMADSTSPFTIVSYLGEWEIKPKGSHGITSMLLLELHASSALTFASNIEQQDVIDAGKNYAIQLYNKFVSPLP